MRNKKIILLLVLLMIMSLIIVGCSGANKPADKKETESKEAEKPQEKKTDYPARPITWIVQYSAGGGTDTMTRVFAKYAEKYLGQSLVIKNVPGAGGEVGVAQMSKSKPDGYTIGGFNNANIILTCMREAAYHPIEDITPIANLVEDPRMFVVRPDDERFPNAEAFIQYAKDNPGKLTIGTSGAGTSGHLTIGLLEMAADIDLKPVHFGGAGEAKAAFLGGHIDCIGQTLGEVMQLVNEGKGKVVAVCTEERLPELPDTPTFKELGIDIEMASKRGVAGPKGLPKEYVDILASAFEKASNDPEYKAEMKKLGLPIKFEGPEKFLENNIKQYEMFKKVVERIKKEDNK